MDWRYDEQETSRPDVTEDESDGVGFHADPRLVLIVKGPAQGADV
jgi:hypothetical protein